MLVALTRERGRNEELRQWVGRAADVVEVPLTATSFRSPDDVRDEIGALDAFGSFASLVVTSSRAQGYLDAAVAALGDDAQVFSAGPATTRTLERVGLRVARESTSTAADLAEFIAHGPVLLLGAAGGREELPAALRAKGMVTSVVACYETTSVELDAGQRAQLRRADAVFIGAPSAWRSAREVVEDASWVLVPGETTLAAVRTDHARVVRGWGEEFTRAWKMVTGSSPPRRDGGIGG